MIKNVIGDNAGKVWTILNENGETLFNEIKKSTKLNSEDLLLAIGWLAREGKIYQSEPYSKNWKLLLIN